MDIDAAAIEDVIAYRPSGSLPSLTYRSNIKAWRFHASASPLEVKSTPMQPGSFSGFDESECYIMLHIYRRADESAPSRPSSASAPPPAPPPTAGSMSTLASSSGQLLSPRGLAAPFSGYDDSGPYPFEQHGSGDAPLAHDLYIWNGKRAQALTKAVALTKCFELERALINDDVGAIHYLHRGMGRALQPAAFATDYVHAKGGDANHLLATLSEHASSEAIQCSSLLSCMLPSLAAVSASSFPELHKALYAHLTPSALHERDLGAGAEPPRSPSASPASSIAAPSPGSTPGASPFASTRQYALPVPSTAAAAAPSLPVPVPASAGGSSSAAAAPRPQRPASAGGNGFHLAGLSSLPQPASDAQHGALGGPLGAALGAEPASARSEPLAAASIGGGMAKLALPKPEGGDPGGGGGGASALPPLGGGGMNKLRIDRISSAHRGEDDGSMSQHERLRIYARKCSQVTDDRHARMGADGRGWARLA